MTKQERIVALRRLRNDFQADNNDTHEKEIEALNWAIKECQKSANRAEAEKRRERGFYY